MVAVGVVVADLVVVRVGAMMEVGATGPQMRRFQRLALRL